MKKWLLGLMLVCLTAGGAWATDVTVSWNNPTTYTDGAQIGAAEASTMVTRVYYSTDQQSWSFLGESSGGGTSLFATWPFGKGVTGWVTCTSTIPAHGQESGQAVPVSWIDQFAPPSAPVNIRITK